MKKNSQRIFLISSGLVVLTLTYFFLPEKRLSIHSEKKLKVKNPDLNSLNVSAYQDDANYQKERKIIDKSPDKKEIFENYSVEEVKLITIASRKKWNPELVKQFISQSKGIKDKEKLKEIAKTVARKDISLRMGLLKWIRLSHGEVDKKRKNAEKKTNSKKLRDIFLKNQ